MELNENQGAFLKDHHAAAMITIARDGTPKAVRVGVAVVEGRIESSGTQGRIRTKRLRRDPRSTLFVFDQGFSYLTIEATVTIHKGSDAAQRNVALFRVMQNRPAGALNWYGEELEEDAFLARMVTEQRLIFEFTPTKAYGSV